MFFLEQFELDFLLSSSHSYTCVFIVVLLRSTWALTLLASVHILYRSKEILIYYQQFR